MRWTFLLMAIWGITANLFGQQDSNIIVPSDDSEIYTQVEKSPLFPAYECQDITERGNNDEFEANQCSEIAFEEFVFEHLKYPMNAFKVGIEGKVEVEFIVEKNGSLTNIKLLNDIGGGCGEAVLKFMNGMKDTINWIPGEEKGEKVRVKIVLPFYFDWSQENKRQGN